jgi:SNF2 family DNA or RNA helicase
MVDGCSNKRELGQLLRESCMIRRLKKEVLKELPPKQRSVVVLDSPDIRKVVAREDELALALKLYEASLSGDEEKSGNQLVETVLKVGIGRVDGDDPEQPNARRLDLDYAAAVLGLEPPAVAVLFEEIAAVRRELGLAKLSAVVPWVKNFLDGDEEKLVLFAYHSDVVEGLMNALLPYSPAVVYGKTPVRKRQAQVDRFQDDEHCRVFIGNMHAAGVGYTLTRGWNVAFAEGDWVPTIMEQAEDRVCRIGQEADAILSFFLVANGSLDARMVQSAYMKEENISEVMDTRA